MSADDRRELLVQAALRVMAREGVAHATTRLIVAEADMPLGVFHYCFRSKEELIEQVMLAISQTSFQAALPALQDGESFQEILRAGVHAYFDHVVEDPHPHQLAHELTQYALRTAPEAAAKQYQSYRNSARAFLASVADGTSYEWQVPLDSVARYLLAIVEGVTIQWLADRETEAARAVLDRCCTSLAAFAMPGHPVGT